MDAGPRAFDHAYLYWVGMETDPRTTPEALAEFNHFYSATHVNEVIAAHPGFISASRYELLDPDPRGGEHAGPRWLAVYEIKDQAAVDQYIKDDARPWLHRRTYSPWPPARKKAKTTWRLLWRQLAAHGSSEQKPEAESIFMVGMNPAPDADETALAEFNDYYTGTHVPEVMQYGGYNRGSRWEVYRAFAHPEPGCPRYVAIYEADAAATAERAERRTSRGKLTPGPPSWEQRDTVWRLVYKRLPPP